MNECLVVVGFGIDAYVLAGIQAPAVLSCLVVEERENRKIGRVSKLPSNDSPQHASASKMS